MSKQGINLNALHHPTCKDERVCVDEELVVLLRHMLHQSTQRELTTASIVVLSLLLDGPIWSGYRINSETP